MEYSPEIQLILNGLNRDRAELSAKLAEVDKVIKQVKTGSINLAQNNTPETKSEEHIKQKTYIFPEKSAVKIQLLSLMDYIGHAAKLVEIQTKYTEFTGSQMTIRDSLRTLNKHNILKIMRAKKDFRGTFWVKTDWLTDNGTKLKNEYKFEGFDQLYKDENMEFV